MIITDPAHADGPVAPLAPLLASLRERPTPVPTAIQLRAKESTARQQLTWGQQLRSLTRAAGVGLLINTRVDVAKACSADGVHLPENGMPIEDARMLLGDKLLIGVSRHDRRGLLTAHAAGADFATLSPIWKVPGKNAPLGLETLGRLTGACPLPVLALGGIAADSIPQVIAAGAHGVAVCRAIYAAASPERALHRLLHFLDSAVPRKR